MAEEQANGVEPEAEEELDIDALLDDAADGGSEDDADDSVDIDSMLDEADDTAADVAEEAPDLDEMDMATEEVMDDPVADTAVEAEAEEESDMDAMLDSIADPDVGLPEPEPTPMAEVAEPPAAAAPAAVEAGGGASSAELNALLAKLNGVADRVEQAVEKGEAITVQLEERHAAAERFVKGVKEVSKEMKEERPSLAKVEKSSSIGMIVGGVTLLLSGAVLGLIATEDKETMIYQVETVSASVDGVGENVNLIAGRIFEQQQQMDEALGTIDSLKEALNKIPEPSEPAPQPVVAEGEGAVAPEMAEVTVDFSAVEGKIDDTQQKIMALHQQLKSSEGRYPELKKYLEQLMAGQQQLKQEQVRLLQIQQVMNEEKERVQTIYKFP